MMKNFSLKRQMIITFLLILLSSITATLFTYAAGFLLFKKLEYKSIYPANYDEMQIPAIEQNIRKQGPLLLSSKEKTYMEQLVPAPNILYQVMDAQGQYLYGPERQKIIQNRTELYDKINTTFSGKNGRYVRLVPLIDSLGNIQGAVSLSYVISPFFAKPTKTIWQILFLVVALSPFLYFILFTALYAKFFAGNIRLPLSLLMEATNKIKNKDLDFHLEYKAGNELGQLCDAFNEMKDELKRSLLSQWKMEHERREMTNALAHDLKTPLTIIQAYAESLREGKIGEGGKRKHYLKVIRDQAKRAGDLVKEMLDAATWESPDHELEREPTNIPTFIQQKVEHYQSLTQEKKIHFRISLNLDQKPCSVDIKKLERILDNIVDNSIRYTPDGGTISIHVQQQEERLSFTICDTGPGFSSKDLTHLFRPFYKGDESRSKESGHAGLGLYIAKQLVHLHGGTIHAYPSPEGGACVTFDLLEADVPQDEDGCNGGEGEN